jgi:Thioredoxin like C-terminal domain
MTFCATLWPSASRTLTSVGKCMPAQTRACPASSASPFNVGASRRNTYATAVAPFVQQRMYQLIRQAKPIRDRRVAIEFLDAGAEVFCFTFG